MLDGVRESKKTNNNMNEVVYLKNGGILRGIIIEQVPNTSLKVQMRDKSIVACRYDEVEKITKENVYLKSDTNDFRRKPGLAWMWSFFFPGAGQIYNGQNLKGALMMVFGLVCTSWNGNVTRIIGGTFVWSEIGYIVMFVLMIGLWIWSQIDAPVMANKLNDR